MNGFRILTILICLVSSAALADENHSADFTLLRGENTIRLSLTNNWNRDIHKLSVKMDEDALPSWLHVTVGKEPAEVISQGEGANSLELSLTVTQTTTPLYADLNLSLYDNVGNQWSVPITVSIQDDGDVPDEFETALLANYPNPFNPRTTIPYSLRESANVDVSIYNALGQRIRTLVDAHQQIGNYHVVWDGCDNQGRSVSSGIYMCRLTAGKYTTTHRMLLME